MQDSTRRKFLSTLGIAAGAVAFAPKVHARALGDIADAFKYREHLDPSELAKDEKFWSTVRAGFDLPKDILNLDHGYCNPLSRVVADDLVGKARHLEQLPGKRLEELYADVTSKAVVPGLARLLGVPSDEIALTRNATEALDTVILGLPMKAGDEIVCCSQDYYAMLDAIEQREKRDGIVVRMVSPPMPAPSMDSIVDAYRKAIGPKTKLVLVTHASNLTGQIYPVKRIAELAHRSGAEVLVDGAQTMALLDHKIPDLDCDYYGASLHKWLMAPVGSGVLWMRKQHVSKIWPIIPPPAGREGMERFMWSGTYPEFISAAAGPAIAFHEKLGPALKEERARYLTSYWRPKAETISGVKFYTSSAPEMSCGLGIFEIDGVDSGKFQQFLWDRHKILVQHMTGGKRSPKINGIRVTPNVYTTPGELDRFVAVLKANLENRDLKI